MREYVRQVSTGIWFQVKKVGQMIEISKVLISPPKKRGMAPKKRSTARAARRAYNITPGAMAPPKHLALRAARRGEAARRANEAGEVRLPYMGEEEEDEACVLMLLYVCPYSSIHVSLCFHPCVLNPYMRVSL